MIEVITGPMFSGKTGELIKRIRAYENAGLKCAVFKPEIKSRNEAEINAIATHDKTNTHPAIVIKDIFEILDLSVSYDIIVIDEAQFLSYNLYRIVTYLEILNKGVIVCGLDMDYKKDPFETIGRIMAVADSVTKLKASCDMCKNEAKYSKRIAKEDERVLIGGSDKYVASCLECYLK
jgi:thymidine kinase